MRRRIAAVLFAAIVSVPAYAGFDDVLAGLRSRLGHPTWIPLFGFIRAGVRVIHPDGVHDLQLAVFEGRGKFDPLDADRLMRTRMGDGYAPLVRARSKHDREWSYIYARAAGDLMDLVVLTNDGEDTVLVRVLVSPEKVARSIDREPRTVALVARH